MAESSNAKRPQLAASELSRIDMICDRFEAAWNSGRPPEIEPYLADVPEPLRSRLQRELEAISAERKGRRGGAMNLERFGRLLLRSGLISAEELTSFQAELGGSPSAEDLARAPGPRPQAHQVPGKRSLARAQRRTGSGRIRHPRRDRRRRNGQGAQSQASADGTDRRPQGSLVETGRLA